MNLNRKARTRLSAVWAAYGDALGFITELADESRVEYRSGSSEVTRTVDWRRKVGVKPGTTLNLPAGSYSDDTQLRLSTSRAIRSDGGFDVASFAKIELPAWMNYALGAGIGSREAASNLARTSATWYSNFFENKRATYTQGGGNGAAMRIQPHVWSTPNLRNHADIYREVVRNSVCTHGHARGIVGACFHAATLALALTNDAPPTMQVCGEILPSLRLLPEIMLADGDLRLFWLGPWVEKTGKRVDVAFGKVVDELAEDIRTLSKISDKDMHKAYNIALEALEARASASRGSAIKTSLLAAFLASLCDLSKPSDALCLAANSLGSDTDSIGTMAGAIIGACTRVDCREPLQDRSYIEAEASRLTDVAMRQSVTSFRYPDLRSWKPARAAIDAIATSDGYLVLEGIGRLNAKFGPPVSSLMGENLQWFELEFGQSILGRLRAQPREASSAQRNINSPEPGEVKVRAAIPKIPDLFSAKANRAVSGNANRIDVISEYGVLTKQSPAVSSAPLNVLLQEVINSGFNHELIGRALLAQVEQGHSNFVELGIALTSTILTAYEARMRKRS